MSQEVIRGIALPPAAQPAIAGARRHAQPGAGPGGLRGQPARHAGLGRPPRRGARPHAKAHKCPQVALRQLALARAASAARRSARPCPSPCRRARHHISNEVVGGQLALLAQRARISVCVDNAANLAHIRGPWPAPASRSTCWWRSMGQGRCGRPTRPPCWPGAAGARPAGRQLRRPAGLSRLGPARPAANAPASAATPRASPRPMPAVAARKRHRLRHHHRRRHRQRRVRCRQRRLHRAAGRLAFMDGATTAPTNGAGADLPEQPVPAVHRDEHARARPRRARRRPEIRLRRMRPARRPRRAGLTCTAINDEHSVVRVELAAPELGAVLRLVRRTSTDLQPA